MECYIHKLKKKNLAHIFVYDMPQHLFCFCQIIFFVPNARSFQWREACFWKAQACSAWYINLQKARGKFPSGIVLKISLMKLKESAFLCSRCLCISPCSSRILFQGLGGKLEKRKVQEEIDAMSNSLAPTQSSMELYPWSQNWYLILLPPTVSIQQLNSLPLPYTKGVPHKLSLGVR